MIVVFSLPPKSAPQALVGRLFFCDVFYCAMVYDESTNAKNKNWGKHHMSETAPEKFYTDQDRAGDERSLYGDMIRSRDFGEIKQYPTDQLNQLGNYWKDQLQNPERSPRARKDIDRLLGRTVFELVMRNIDHVALSKQQAEEDAAWAAYTQELAE